MVPRHTARKLLVVCVGLATAVPTIAFAQQDTLKSVAQRAVLSNPEILQKWHAYQATDNEKDAAFGGYLPRVDLSAGVGREKRNDPIWVKDYTQRSTTLTLTQMLYDGFGTRNEVQRLDHARQVRYFELLDASENIALEAARAYLDVLRYRKLVELAEDNYIRHRAVFEQIQKKAQAGVARRVDLEQASGRLALAESNLLTETSNLYDVNVRFQRLVGATPAKDLAGAPTLATGLPADAATMLQTVINRSPAIQGAIENVRSADSAVDVRKAAYQPRVDLRLKSEKGTDLNGYIGSTDNRTAEVVLTWNLFNGLSDMARSRQYADQRSVAKDLRDKTCRDVRQTAAIAYNDTRKLAEQLTYLDQHQLATEKARDAYRKQFDIGQRTLLDLLDTENELFQAKRAYVNAEHDLLIAQARSQASLGNLLPTLELNRVARDEVAAPANWTAEGDAAEHCPPDETPAFVVDKAALNARAVQFVNEVAPPPAPVPAPVVAPAPKCQFGAALAADANFGYGKSALTLGAMKNLDDLAKDVGNRCGTVDSVRVVAHSDRLGSVQANQEVSEQRAVAVKSYLLSKGLNPRNFEAIGVGSTEPLPGTECAKKMSRAKLKECLAPNRRVTIEVRGVDK
jgi:adhesin transport system outer membrane protein